MNAIKTKTLQRLEERMENLDENSLRYQILENAKKFKTSWLDLGRALYSVWKDKMYKEWGYGVFDAYITREIGIRKQTAMKLLRSYYFLEQQEPQYLKEEYYSTSNAASLPNYESIDVLRMAKNKKILDTQNYDNFKKEIFEKGKDARQVKKDLVAMMKERRELEPKEAWKKRKISTVKRFLGILRSLKEEIEAAKLLPAPIIKEVAALIRKLEAEVSS